jgi:hypothetical protein
LEDLVCVLERLRIVKGILKNESEFAPGERGKDFCALVWGNYSPSVFALYFRRPQSRIRSLLVEQADDLSTDAVGFELDGYFHGQRSDQ